MIIVAVAMTFVITTGGIDLSVGSTVALVNALAAIALGSVLPWPRRRRRPHRSRRAHRRRARLVHHPRGDTRLHRDAGRHVDAAGRRTPAHPGFLDTHFGAIRFRVPGTRLGARHSAAGNDRRRRMHCRHGGARRHPVRPLHRRHRRQQRSRPAVGHRHQPSNAHRLRAHRSGRFGCRPDHRRAAGQRQLECRRWIRAGGDCGRGSRRHLTHGRPRLDRRHGSRSADHRRHRQWSDPRPCFALFHTNHNRRHHPRRHLAQHPQSFFDRAKFSGKHRETACRNCPKPMSAQGGR